MAKHFLRGKKVVSALGALSAAMLLMTSCSTKTDSSDSGQNAQGVVLPPPSGPVTSITTPVIPDVPLVAPIPEWDTIELMVRTDPVNPQNERFLDDWRFTIFTIDDEGRPTSPFYFGETGFDGNALIGLPSYMFALPLLISASNDALPLRCDPIPGITTNAIEEDTGCECQSFEIFVPAFCHDKAVWLLGPFENALWRFYRRAAERRGEAWNPSQVDCGTWLANMQLLILTDEVADELNDFSDTDTMIFREEVLVQALQENQHLLVPTRPPICMAERRHNGGGMEEGETISLPAVLDDNVSPFGPAEVMPDDDPIVIGVNGTVDSICGTGFDGSLAVNGVTFAPTASFVLDDQDFIGVISDETNIVPKIDLSVYNTRLGNGLELDADKYDDACALTSIIEFTNTDDDEQDLLIGTGVTFANLFGDGSNTAVFLTSDGDNVVDDNDYWAIFYRSTDSDEQESVIAVELLGHRQEDFRDVLHMVFNTTTDDLFLGLRADFELNEEEVDGERAFLAYTISVWDGTSLAGRRAVRDNIANCYEAADVWARQFFITRDFDGREDECCLDEDCVIDRLIPPLEAAEFAVRSQCFSNSRANQRWRTDDSGFWSINTDHGVHGDVIVNPGWLAPNLDFEIYIQKFDEAVFKGPRTVRRTDDVGQLMVELPTLVEGDRVLIKAEDNCCDDYDLVLPCVPEFTGFAGAPGIPYVPVTLGPPPIGPVPPVAPVAGGPVPPVGGVAGVPAAGPVR